MEHRDEELMLETVDELIEQLLQTSALPASSRSPLAQTVHHLHELFEEDRSLEQVWARLVNPSQLAGSGESTPENETREGGKLVPTLQHSDDEVLTGSKNPLMTVSGTNGTIQKGREHHPMLKEHSPVPLDSETRHTAAPRKTRFPRAARFMQMAAAVLIVSALVAGFLLVFSMHSGTPHRTTQTGAPSSPPGIYISRSDGVYRYNSQTRKVIWHTHVAGQSLAPGRFTLIGDTVYITFSGLAGSPLVFALDAQTGALRWSRTFPSSVESPFLDEGVLYFPTDPIGSFNSHTRTVSPRVYALYTVNPATGSITATYTLRYGKSWYNPVVVNGILYYTDDFSDDILYAVQLPGEKLLWQRQLSTEQLNMPADGGIAVDHGIVYIPVTPETTSQHGWIDAFDAYTGKQLWQSPAIMIADGPATLTITNTMIYAATLLGNSGKLLAFDVHTHVLVWQEPLETFDMQVVSHTLYIQYDTANEDSSVAALNASTGKLLWKTPLNRVAGDNLIGILNGILYYVAWTTLDGNAYTGTIYALNASNGTQIWAMPTNATVLQWGGMVVA
jgi:outer membrane protein assembly factor BamB